MIPPNAQSGTWGISVDGSSRVCVLLSSRPTIENFEGFRDDMAVNQTNYNIRTIDLLNVIWSTFVHVQPINAQYQFVYSTGNVNQ